MPRGVCDFKDLAQPEEALGTSGFQPLALDVAYGGPQAVCGGGGGLLWGRIVFHTRGQRKVFARLGTHSLPPQRRQHGVEYVLLLLSAGLVRLLLLFNLMHHTLVSTKLGSSRGCVTPLGHVTNVSK